MKEKKKVKKKVSGLPVDVVDGSKVALGGLLRTNEGLCYAVKAIVNLQESKVVSFSLDKADIPKMSLDRVDHYISEADRTRGENLH
jgi:hypothetical protein